MSEEVIIINDEPFYRIPNGTSYDYAPIPKEFKPYFERLQQENTQLKKENQMLKDKMNFSYHIRNDTTSIPAVVRKANDVELIKKLQQENTYLKKSLENAQDIYKNSHKYTSECEDKVIELKSVLKEIKEHITKRIFYASYDDDVYFEKVVSFTDNELDNLLEIIDKGIGE